jgi:2-keto-4-pentenoate hydratase/2-oxohepta-3-ene-1,7-dioic acid hydratase in catechol pathway
VNFRKSSILLLMCRSDLIFSIPKLISFLSQGTTLQAGTIILTGTPAGVGVSRNPRISVRAGDEFAVEILPHIGTLINKFENDQ